MFSSVELEGAEFLGAGANRYCVISPNDDNVCLKIDIPIAQRQCKNWRQAIKRHLSKEIIQFNENYIEWMAYKKLTNRFSQVELDQFIAGCFDLHKTPDGQLILACQLIRNADHSIALSLDHHLKNGTVFDLVQINQAVDELSEWLVRHSIPLFDLNSGNLVVQYNKKSIRLMCIDIKSTYKGKEIIPISYWSKKIMQKKIRRRSERLKKTIQLRMNKVL
ncbi:YrbL family protein [Acinetobacter sp. YH12085]|uniref:YrbL family protein n=1 Tax=Acinetobacter sp. YH12085 TaxID=2601077 RepID=UPI0015D2CB38|nr:YrbL family protein [Acinetobacter sp. YH12085]